MKYTSPRSTATPPLAAAGAAYADALARRDDLAAKVLSARAALAAAGTHKRTLIDNAAAGAPLAAQDIRQAEDATHAVECDLVVAEALAEAGQRHFEASEIALFHARAGALRADEAGLLAQAAEHARAVDTALADARAALARLQDTAVRLGSLSLISRDLAGQIAEAGRRNATLAGQHRSTWPKPPTVAVPVVAALAIDLTRGSNVPQPGAEDRRIHRPLAEWLGVAPALAKAA